MNEELDAYVAWPDPSSTDAELGVVGWRAASLVAAGYCESDALALALDPTVDLHLAVRLIQRGCPADTARRILT